LRARASADTGGRPIPSKLSKPKLFVTDVDGTLLNSKQALTQPTERAVREAAAAGVLTVVATGKTRGPWSKEVLPRLGAPMPGIFCQGLLVYDADGEVIYSNPLPDELAAEGIDFAKSRGVSLVAFCKDRILCEARDEQTDRVLDFGEPAPEAVGPMKAVLGKVQMHKLILLGGPEIDELRPEAEAHFAGRAALTTAIGGMLEILPLGASKGQAMGWLLNHMGVDAADVVAFGDGENDIEMLQAAGLGVAMGQAGEKVSEVADATTLSNDEDGVAHAIEAILASCTASA